MRGVAVTERSSRPPVSELEFVGCLPVRVSRDEVEGPEWEGRKVEHWDAATETAWIVREPASPYHERPSRRLTALVERICQARGSDAACFGGVDLRVRQEDGTLGDFMQADETVYLRPSRSKLPQGVALMVGEDAYPDVVLEVDNTTDVRRGKLVAYAEWGFPEVWVEVPDLASPGRPRGLHPGLAIHLLENGRYVEAAKSRAFPGWRADEIHRALNEPTISEETAAVLWRVGRALGEREGTGPEDDSLLGGFGRRERALGVAEGHARGLVTGMAGMAAAILRRRGIAVSEGFAAELAARRESSPTGSPFSKRLPRRRTRRTSSPAWADGRGRLAMWFALLLLVSLTVWWTGGLEGRERLVPVVGLDSVILGVPPSRGKLIAWSDQGRLGL